MATLSLKGHLVAAIRQQDHNYLLSILPVERVLPEDSESQGRSTKIKNPPSSSPIWEPLVRPINSIASPSSFLAPFVAHQQELPLPVRGGGWLEDLVRGVGRGSFWRAIQSVHFYLCEPSPNSSSASSFFHFRSISLPLRNQVDRVGLQTRVSSAKARANVTLAYMSDPNSSYLLVVI